MEDVKVDVKVDVREKPKYKFQGILIDRCYGEEPIWDGVTVNDPDFRLKLGLALNWANGVITHEQLKQELLAYLSFKDLLIAKLVDIHPAKFIDSGKLAWLYNNGCPFTEKLQDQLDTKISGLIKQNINEEVTIVGEDGEPVVVEPIVKVGKIALRSKNHYKKIGELYSFVEEVIDSGICKDEEIDESTIYHSLTKDKADARIVKHVYDRLRKKYLELQKEYEYLEKISEDEKISVFDDVESYTKYSQDIEINRDSYVSAINQVSSFLGNKRALKKSERKFGNKITAKRIEAQVSKLNFKVQDSTFKVMSISPTSVVGCMTLLAFNTKTRKISIYVALDDAGLDIKGTTIYNYDQDISVQKIVKKPDMLQKFQEANLVRVKILFRDHIKAKESACNGRINEHTILLKVFDKKYSHN